MHPSIVRRVNAVRLFHALRLNPGLSQREIGDRTGVDKSTISAIVNHFDAIGLLDRRQDQERKRGRPGEAIRLRPEAALLAGLHIEPDGLLIVLSGLDGLPIQSRTLPMPQSFGAIPERLAEGLRDLVQEARRSYAEIRCAGVCVPGLVTEDGRIAESSNMKWWDLELRTTFADALGLPVVVGNESHAAGFAEKLFGACLDLDDYVYVANGSGVGGALFLTGEIYRGSGGFAGELGHLKIVPHGRLCDCGASGCLSAYLSEPALNRRFAQAGRAVTGCHAMAAAAQDGDTVTATILDEAGEMLGIAVADLVNLFNPPTVVLGGGLAILADHLRAGLDRSLIRHALVSSRQLVQIIVSDLATDPVLRGGLALALGGLSDPLGEGPFPW